ESALAGTGIHVCDVQLGCAKRGFGAICVEAFECQRIKACIFLFVVKPSVIAAEGNFHMRQRILSNLAFHKAIKVYTAIVGETLKRRPDIVGHKCSEKVEVRLVAFDVQVYIGSPTQVGSPGHGKRRIVQLYVAVRDSQKLLTDLIIGGEIELNFFMSEESRVGRCCD